KRVGPIDAGENVAVAVGPEHLVIGRGPEPERLVVIRIGPEIRSGPERAGKAGASEERRIEPLTREQRRIAERASRDGARIASAEGAERRRVRAPEIGACLHRRAAQRRLMQRACRQRGTRSAAQSAPVEGRSAGYARREGGTGSVTRDRRAAAE